MEPSKCKNCGASDFIRKGDKYVCQYCGTEYPIPKEELEKEKQSNPAGSRQNSSSSNRFQYTPSNQEPQKAGYVDAASNKPEKKKLSRTSQTLIVVIIVVAVIACASILSGSDDEDDNATVMVETETDAGNKNEETNVTEQDESSATESETGVTNVEVQKTNDLSPVIDDFNYEISGNEVMLKSYSGNNSILEIYPTYTIDDIQYNTNLMDFQVRDHDVETIIFDEGITEFKTSIFNGSNVKAIYFPSSMINVYDYALSYLHPDEGEKIKIYYSGTEEQWYSIFTEYQRTKVSDAEFGGEMGVAMADALNEFIGAEYDSSEFEYFFKASQDDLK